MYVLWILSAGIFHILKSVFWYGIVSQLKKSNFIHLSFIFTVFWPLQNCENIFFLFFLEFLHFGFHIKSMVLQK